MARKPNKDKVTSKKAASAASKTIRSAKASPAAKSAAGSALSQRPSRNFVTSTGRPTPPPKRKR